MCSTSPDFNVPTNPPCLSAAPPHTLPWEAWSGSSLVPHSVPFPDLDRCRSSSLKYTLSPQQAQHTSISYNLDKPNHASGPRPVLPPQKVPRLGQTLLLCPRAPTDFPRQVLSTLHDGCWSSLVSLTRPHRAEPVSAWGTPMAPATSSMPGAEQSFNKHLLNERDNDLIKVDQGSTWGSP